MSGLFVTSTGTSVGKTLVTCGLIHQMRAAGVDVGALKPVQSGFSDDDKESDAAKILRCLGRGSLEDIAPWRFEAALSPHLAAAQEIDFEKLVQFCTAPYEGVRLIEGAGGVMSPVNWTQTSLDLIARVGYPVILVVGSYLGTISHTLTAAKALGLLLKSVAISASDGDVHALRDTERSLRAFLPGVPVVAIPRLAADAEAWQHLPDLGALWKS